MNIAKKFFKYIWITSCISFAYSQNAHSEEVVINDNGAWCWYQDERVIVSGDYLVVGSVASSAGKGGQARDGNIEVTSYNFATGEKPSVNVMHDGLEDDDHNLPALLELPDKRVLAIYSKHNADRNIRFRKTQEKDNLNLWQDEVVMARKDKITYANLIRLSGENNNKGRLYNFYRGIKFNPTFDISDDEGDTWSKGTHFISNQGRPYVKYISNNKDTIHFVTTEQHPRVFDNSIYHGYMRDGKIYRSDGTFVKAITDGPVKPTELTKIYQGGPNNVGWTVDLHLDRKGRPYTVFSVQTNDGGKNRKMQKHGDDHRYYYARFTKSNFWSKKKWLVNEMAYAGSRLYDQEQDYTGLVALNPQNPNEVVISTDANPVTGEKLISNKDSLRHYELFKGKTQNKGKTWKWEYLTRDSSEDNIRPVIPVYDKEDLMLLWMRGRYISYTETATEIVYSNNPASLGEVK